MDRDQFQNAMLSIMVDFHHLVAKGLGSFRQLEEPIGPLALGVVKRKFISDKDNCAVLMNFHSTRKNKNPSCVFIFYYGNHQGSSRFAQLITKHPQDTQTVVAVKVALPGKMDSTRKMQRLAQNSLVSVFTMVDGVVKTVVQQEPLSTPGGGVKLWLSDFVKERESLPDEFIRPFHAG